MLISEKNITLLCHYSLLSVNNQDNRIDKLTIILKQFNLKYPFIFNIYIDASYTGIMALSKLDDPIGRELEWLIPKLMLVKYSRSGKGEIPKRCCRRESRQFLKWTTREVSKVVRGRVITIYRHTNNTLSNLATLQQS